MMYFLVRGGDEIAGGYVRDEKSKPAPDSVSSDVRLTALPISPIQGLPSLCCEV